MRRVLVTIIVCAAGLAVAAPAVAQVAPCTATGDVPIAGSIRFADAGGLPVSPQRQQDLATALRWALQVSIAQYDGSSTSPKKTFTPAINPDATFVGCVPGGYNYRIATRMWTTDYVPEAWVDTTAAAYLHEQLRTDTARFPYDVNEGQMFYVSSMEGVGGKDFLLVPHDYYSPERRNGTLLARLVDCRAPTPRAWASQPSSGAGIQLVGTGKYYSRSTPTDGDGRFSLTGSQASPMPSGVSPWYGYRNGETRLGMVGIPTGYFRPYVWDGTKMYYGAPFWFQPREVQALSFVNWSFDGSFGTPAYGETVTEYLWAVDLGDVCVPAIPGANAGPDQQVPTADPTGVLVMLDGRGSTSPSGSTLTYRWREGDTTVGTASTVTLRASIGVHTYTLTVTDTNGSSSSDTVTVTVTDVTAPLREEIDQWTAAYQACSADKDTIAAQVDTLTALFRLEFGNPAFVVPGDTLQDQLANLVAAIQNLNHGQRQALYVNLGGKKK